MRLLSRLASARSWAWTARNKAACRSAMTLPLPERSPLQPSTRELSSQALWVVSTLTGGWRLCSFPNVHFVLRHVARPIFDGADGGDLLDQLQQRFARIALTGRQRVLEGDNRQGTRVGDTLEVLDCHRRRLSERERRRREHQKRRGTALFGHARDAHHCEAAVGPDAVDD